MNILVYRHEANGEAYPIQLIQTGKERFTVVYGLQRDTGLSYGEAARKLGEAIMHKAACDGDMVIDHG
jgi:hypothetical protein